MDVHHPAGGHAAGPAAARPSHPAAAGSGGGGEGAGAGSGGSLRFDLHVHTRRLSEDARLDPLAAAERLRALGYAGFAITEHDAVWPLPWLQELRRATPLIVIRGLEIQTEEVGHVLVYGWDDEPIWRYHRLPRLMAAVRAKGAVAAVAHPYRRRSAPWGTPADAATAAALLPWWRTADGVEADNGRASPAENRLAAALAARLGGLAVAGSDAHRLEDLGRAATLLPAGVTTWQEALAALRNRRVRTPVDAACGEGEGLAELSQMNVLIALDIDGTVDTAYGPVPFAAVQELVAAGVPVAVVSPSSGWPGGLPTFIAGPTRADNLRACRTVAPEASMRLYISDNRDNAEAQLAGFALVEPSDFAAMLRG